MSTINKQNYEAWFLDYFEDNLSPEQSKQLFQFLDAHPEFWQAFNEYELIALEPEQFSFNTNSLLRPVSNELANEISGTDYMAISYSENILSAKDKINIEKLIKEDNVLKDAIDVYAQLKLKPDITIVFEEKNKLKKPRVITFYGFKEVYKYIASAAAAILFALTVWNYFPEENNRNISGLRAPLKRPELTSRQKILNNESFKNSATVEQVPKSTIEYKKNKKNNVQTIKNAVNIENKEINTEYKINYTAITEQNIEVLDTQKHVENIIKADAAIANNIEIIKKEKYLSPDNLIVSKLLKTDSDALLNNGSQKKSKFWNVLDLASRRYSNVTGRKVKIKKVDKENNTTVFALITDKFEISHTESKK